MKPCLRSRWTKWSPSPCLNKLAFPFLFLYFHTNMSLNGLRRRVATHDNTQNGTQMGEPLVALEPEHWVLASGATTLSFRQPKNRLLEYLQH
jgi:hypothetical protein